MPDFGLLPEDFPTGFLRYFDLTTGATTTLSDGVEIALNPFLGTMGNHLDDPRQGGPFPPHKGGGNIDTKHLVKGASLYLPVYVDGAKFSCGDPHGAQGDGEVCVSAIETSMDATLRFTLHKFCSDAPWFVVPDSEATATPPGGYYGTTGIGPDLMQGAKDAVRGMIGLARGAPRTRGQRRLRALQPRRRPAHLRDRRLRRVERRLHAAALDLRLVLRGARGQDRPRTGRRAGPRGRRPPSASGSTSAYFWSMSKRLIQCDACPRSNVHSSTTAMRKL